MVHKRLERNRSVVRLRASVQGLRERAQNSLEPRTNRLWATSWNVLQQLGNNLRNDHCRIFANDICSIMILAARRVGDCRKPFLSQKLYFTAYTYRNFSIDDKKYNKFKRKEANMWHNSRCVQFLLLPVFFHFLNFNSSRLNICRKWLHKLNSH